MGAAVGVVVVAAAAALGGTGLLGDDGPVVAPELTAVVAADGVPPVDERIAAWRNRIEPGDGDIASRSYLARNLLARGQETGDLDSFLQARSTVREALAVRPDDAGLLALDAAVAHSLHEFADAEAVAEELVAGDPHDAQALAVLGDARLELGDLVGAEDAYLRLGAEAGPTAPVLARRSRLSWVRGDTAQAVALSEQAVVAAGRDGAGPAAMAFHQSLLAGYLVDSGHRDAAAAVAEAAVANAPSSPGAQATLGRVRASQGRLDDAAAAYEAAVAVVPSPEHLAALGDVYAALGRSDDAAEQYDTVDVIGQLAEEQRSVYDRGLVRFLADHGRDPERAVALARAELAVRRDAHGHDALAWALHAAGRADEADAAMADALALGIDEPRVWFHAGMIAAAVGDEDRARRALGRALELDDRFDPLQAPLAERTLRSLEGGT
jgi:tetratricopeptide (TPR) repeat protein